jgi:hypothetical protein
MRIFCTKTVISILLVVSFSCHHQADFLQQSLSLADSNRTELERVLSHYSENPADSLKYRAAVFLIENMGGKRSLDTASVAANQPFFDALANYLRRNEWYVNNGVALMCDSVKAT